MMIAIDERQRGSGTKLQTIQRSHGSSLSAKKSSASKHL